MCLRTFLRRCGSSSVKLRNPANHYENARSVSRGLSYLPRPPELTRYFAVGRAKPRPIDDDWIRDDDFQGSDILHRVNPMVTEAQHLHDHERGHMPNALMPRPRLYPLRDIVGFPVVGSFSKLGIFGALAHKIVEGMRARCESITQTCVGRDRGRQIRSYDHRRARPLRQRSKVKSIERQRKNVGTVLNCGAEGSPRLRDVANSLEWRALQGSPSRTNQPPEAVPHKACGDQPPKTQGTACCSRSQSW